MNEQDPAQFGRVGAAVPKRLSLADSLSEIADEWIRPDRGFPRTLWRLSVQPAQALADWIERRDSRATRPFRYLMVMVAVAALLWLGDGRSIDWAEWYAGASASADASARSRSNSLSFVLGHGLATVKRSHPEVLILLGLPLLAGAIFGGTRMRLNAAESWAVALYASAQSLLAVTLIGLAQRWGLEIATWHVWLVAALVWMWTVSGSSGGKVVERIRVAALSALLACWLLAAVGIFLLITVVAIAPFLT